MSMPSLLTIASPTVYTGPTSSKPQCAACTLKAIDPVTLTYPNQVVGNLTITTASVLAFPTYYPGGARLYTISYTTIFITEVFPHNETSIVSATWTTYDTALYVLVPEGVIIFV